MEKKSRDERTKAIIRRQTRVIYRINSSKQYLMTNETGEITDLTHVFYADHDGKIYMEGLLLGSILAHDPDIIPELEEMDCTFVELNPDYFRKNPVLGGVIGLAVGDAFGVPVEFLSREEVQRINLQEMVGKDTGLEFSSRWSDLIPSGAWSDDTSMTIAAMASMIDHKGNIDYEDIMERFRLWWYKGYYCCLKYPFGLGRNISKALERYIQGFPALECGGKGLMDNGNGALMRMFPFAIFCILNELNDDETVGIISNATGITHGHDINKMSCFVYTQFLRECLRTHNPQMSYAAICNGRGVYYGRYFSREAIEAHEGLLDLYHTEGFGPEQVQESGYVVDSLKVAIYSILNTSDYESAVKMAVNFGYDTDTNGTITGSIAGALYGYDNIPKRWLASLKKREELIRLAEQFKKCICNI